MQASADVLLWTRLKLDAKRVGFIASSWERRVTVDLEKTRRIVSLLNETTSLAVISDFLKAKGLKHSASSWDDMLNKRIIPAVESYAVTNADLVQLLRSAEECGRQHVFLYTCPSATAVDLINRQRVEAATRRLGIESLLTEPLVLVQPPQPQLVDVRWETADVDLALVIKEVELRTYTKFFGTEQHGDRFHKVYGPVHERAVNMARLHRSGLLEIRISSHTNTSKYENDVFRFFNAISALIPSEPFRELSLSTAKDRLWTERSTLRDLVRYSDSTLRDEQGNILRAATGSEEGDLVANAAVANSLDYLLTNDENSYCDGANFWFKKGGARPNDIHVVLAGEPNEFALPSNCSAEDYMYVLDQLRFFNQRVS